MGSDVKEYFRGSKKGIVKNLKMFFLVLKVEHADGVLSYESYKCDKINKRQME